MKLSCKRCQFRKLKCSRNVPCSNCAAAGLTCEYRERQHKQRPISREYVTLLENRVAWLESTLGRLKRASSIERESILAESSFGDHLDNTVCNFIPPDPAQPVRLWTPNLRTDAEGALIYHGPTSIYQAGQLPALERGQPLSLLGGVQSSEVSEHFGLREDLITSGLQHFFKWQYPHFMFVYREAFLRDYYYSYYGGKYWSQPLLYAICALGTLMTTDTPDSDPADSEVSHRFSAASESLLMVFGIEKPCVTTLQAFLCLSFYEMGRGNLSKAWTYSGIAFRMGHDIGFHQDPRNWVFTDCSIIADEDIEIRRRIYWGCYLSDKIISLMLGRETYLHKEDAAVVSVDTLPDLPEMISWLPVGCHDPLLTNPDTEPRPIDCFRNHIELAKIIQNMLSRLCHITGDGSPNTHQTLSITQDTLNGLNLDLCRWEEALPASLRWNKWEPSSAFLYPHVAALQVLFNTMRLCLNIDFAVSSGEAAETSRTICSSSVENMIALVRKYKRQHGLRKAPLLFIYGIVQAANATSILANVNRQLQVTVNEGSSAQLQLDFFIEALDESSATWPLAKQAKAAVLEFVRGSDSADLYPLFSSPSSSAGIENDAASI